MDESAIFNGSHIKHMYVIQIVVGIAFLDEVGHILFNPT